MATWAIVVPAHNSAPIIRNTVNEISEYFRRKSISGQVIIVENGSKDDTWEAMTSIDEMSLPFELVRTRSDKGLGNAVREGLSHVTTDYVLITADDLPFGFSDLDQYFMTELKSDLAIGSKAHPETDNDRSISRRIMSGVFRIFRWVVLGMKYGDTQGSVMGRTNLICQLASETKQENYLISTEMIALADRRHASVVELPVSFRSSIRESNINVVKDSIKMIRGLFQVRQSVKT